LCGKSDRTLPTLQSPRIGAWHRERRDDQLHDSATSKRTRRLAGAELWLDLFPDMRKAIFEWDQPAIDDEELGFRAPFLCCRAF
jgi:hypothetical protein